MTLAELRAEGVIEVGVVGQFAYVKTRRRVSIMFGLGQINMLRDVQQLRDRWRWLREQDYTIAEIAAMYGVHDSVVIEITNAGGWQAPLFDVRARRRRRNEGAPAAHGPLRPKNMEAWRRKPRPAGSAWQPPA